MRCLARALKIPENDFEETIIKDPSIQFGLFRYSPDKRFQFGIPEHTDYGLLSFVCIDNTGGLQIKTLDGKWMDVPLPEAGKHNMVINIGDMLQKISNGKYRSTPHRVKTQYDNHRLSFPFFFNPSWNTRVGKQEM